jgi:hypothetical protein
VKRQIKVPQIYEEWRDLAVEALEADGTNLEEYPTASPGMLSHQRHRRDVQGPIHCECAVALAFIGNRSLPTIPYIGVSKLSCLSCHYFFEALREGGYNFHTRGTHSKAYFPWKYPDQELLEILPGEESELRNRLVARLIQSYAAQFRVTEKARSKSDSSASDSDQSLPWESRLDELSDMDEESLGESS